MTKELKPTTKLTKEKVYQVLNKVSIYAVLVIFALWILVPFSIIISTSIKTWQEANSLGFSFFPKEFSIEGYIKALEFSYSSSTMPILIRGFLNTMLFVLPTTVLGLLLSSISGYAFAKMNFKGKN